MRTRTAILTGAAVVCALLAPASARAQYSLYSFPVEQAYLDSHADLQLAYSHYDDDRGGRAFSLDIVTLSVEGQYAILDRLEVGLNIPFLVHGSATAGLRSSDETEFGDIILGLKGKLFGARLLAIALYVNTRLPTHSGDLGRDYAMMIMGGGVTVKVIGITLGANLEGDWIINGDGDDLALLGMDFYGGVKLFGRLSLNLAFQFRNAIHPDTDFSPFAILPGVEFNPWRGLRIGLGTRVAVNDDALFFYAGRASLLFWAGYSF